VGVGAHRLSVIQPLDLDAWTGHLSGAARISYNAYRTPDEKKAAVAQRMHTSGESASSIVATLDVSCATVYRVIAER
jgi:DNA invertase Pin-like site-specific DNA recombinase